MNQNYDAIKDYFETATASQQRGKTSEAGLIAYASYLLERIEPSPKARLLDVGCGDGLPMKKMNSLRPDIHIDGIEISHNLAKAARTNNPSSKIWEGNIL